MPNSAAPSRPTSRPAVSAYTASWAVLALSAMAYMGWIVTNPDMMARLTPGSSSTEGESNQGQRAASDGPADVASLKSGLDNVQRDVAQLRSEMSTMTERSVEIGTRLAALEDRSAVSTAAADTAATLAAPSAAAAAPTAGAKPAPAASAPKVLNPAPAAAAPSPRAMETGSVSAAKSASIAAAAAEPIVFGPAVVKPAPKPIGIRIATGPSVDSLRLSWSLLSDRHADTLKNLEARFTTGTASPVDGGAMTYDLVAGPLKSSAEAKKVCAALEARAVPCKVETFGGDSL
ncbi:MAG: hypothetical protein ACT4N2_12300 [Hyphomicrobium sp.]